MRSYPVMENPIGSAVSEILRYTHTDRETNTHLVTFLEGSLAMIKEIAKNIHL